jgi:short-subunit dehydrogenase
MDISGKVIVVTGGGSGIGRATVLALLQKGGKVAAVDIQESSLDETVALAEGKTGDLSVHVVDVADRKKVEKLPAQVIEKHNAVDALINNAGIIQPFLSVNELDYESIERVLNVNLWGQIHMIKSFLPELLLRPEGYIVNVSSMGGFFPFPGQTLYGASKAAVKLLSEGLYAELLESNVGVSVVFPGATATNISVNSGLEDMVGGDGESSSFPTTSAEDAAEAIITAIEKGKFQTFIGKDSKLMNLLYKVSPKKATQFMQKQMKALLPE